MLQLVRSLFHSIHGTRKSNRWISQFLPHDLGFGRFSKSVVKTWPFGRNSCWIMFLMPRWSYSPSFIDFGGRLIDSKVWVGVFELWLIYLEAVWLIFGGLSWGFGGRLIDYVRFETWCTIKDLMISIDFLGLFVLFILDKIHHVLRKLWSKFHDFLSSFDWVSRFFFASLSGWKMSVGRSSGSSLLQP